MRYAKPVVEKTESSRAASRASSSGLGAEVERADREMMGNEEKEVDMVATVGRRADRGKRGEVYVWKGDEKTG